MIWTKYLVKSKVTGEDSLVFNTLTGAVDVFPSSFLDDQPENLSADVRHQLIERGYLFNNKAEEEKVFEQISRSLTNKVVSFTVCPTFSCNLACTYCFEGILTKRNDTLTEEMIKGIHTAISQLKKENHKNGFALFGGEPLLKKNKQLVENLLGISRKLSIPVSIITNGIELDYYKNLIAKNTDMVKIIQLTIDGDREYTDKRRIFANGRGTFDRIMSNIELISDLDIQILLRINIDHYNFNSLDNLSEFIITRGWNERKNMHFELALLDTSYKETVCSQMNEQQLLERFNERLKENSNLSVFSVNQSKRFLGYLSDVLEQKESRYGPRPYYCEACSGGSYVFGADGFIYPCTEALGIEDMQVGRFYPKFELFELMKEWEDRTVLKMEKCRQCNIAFVCSGGCAFRAAKKYGTPLKPHCEGVKEVVETFMKKKAAELGKKQLANSS